MRRSCHTYACASVFALPVVRHASAAFTFTSSSALVVFVTAARSHTCIRDEYVRTAWGVACSGHSVVTCVPYQDVRVEFQTREARTQQHHVMEQQRLLQEARDTFARETAAGMQPPTFDHPPGMPMPPSMRREASWSSHDSWASAGGTYGGASASSGSGQWWEPGQFPGLHPFHWVEADPYHCLGLQRNAPLSRVKQRYRKLALALHPDKRCPHPSATDAFHAVTKACRDIEERVHGSGSSQQM